MKNALESSSSDSHSGDNVIPASLSGHPGDSRTVSFISKRTDESSVEPVNEGDKTVISQRPIAPAEEFYRSMPLAELASNLEGKQLDHFSVDTMIGGGGMGAVFRGVDLRLDRVVAVKVIPSSKRDADTLRRFRLEAQAAARLDHPNIARVYYVGEAEQWNYIVFEFIDGINIRDLVEMDGPLSIDDAVFYTRQVAEALQHAHERDVVHRDVKPSNVLVTANGIAKLVDMGLARDTSLDKSTADATASGVTLGTFDYISPEQARNPRDADVRSDLYSLGCTLFYMLTGNPPFPDGTALQKLLNHGSVAPPDPRSWREDVSDQLFEVIMKLMAKRPADRYQKPVELVNDLLLLAEIENLPRSQAPSTLMLSPTIAQRTLLETNLPWLVALAFLLGSALWLQSIQSLPTGVTLPSLKFSEESTAASSSSASLAPETIAQESRPAGSVGSESVQPSRMSSRSESLGKERGAGNENSTVEPFEAESLRKDVSRVQQNLTSSNSEVSLQPTYVRNTTSNGERSVDASPAESNRTNGSAIEYPRIDAVETKPTAVSADTDEKSSELLRDESGASIGPKSKTSNPTSSSTSSPNSSASALNNDILVVSPKRPAEIPVHRWESSLAQAVQRVRGKPAVIEIHGRILLDRPIVLEGQDIELRAGASPATIDIPPSAGASADAATAFVVSNSKLRLNGVAMSTNRSVAATSPTTLFHLDGDSALAIERCLFTVDGNFPNRHAIITLGAARASIATGTLSSSVLNPSMEVTIDASQIRGATSLLRVEQMTNVGRPRQEISIKRSLVTIDGVAVDLETVTAKSETERIIRLFCEQSTFVTGEGFAVLRFKGDSLPLVGLSRSSRGCVFWSRPGVPHIAIYGESAGLLENPNLLLLQGLDNAYDENIENICQTYSNGTEIFDLDFSDGQQEGWFNEKSYEREVSWTNNKSVLRSRPFSRSTAVDFQLKAAMFVPGYPTELSNTPTVE